MATSLRFRQIEQKDEGTNAQDSPFTHLLESGRISSPADDGRYLVGDNFTIAPDRARCKV